MEARAMTADVELLPFTDYLRSLSAHCRCRIDAYTRANVAQATAAKDAQIEAAMVLILRSDAECLVRDHERFSTTGSSTVGGRLAAKRVRSLLAGQQQGGAE